MKNSLFIILILAFGIQTAHAQVFGRNKPVYQNFDFKVVETPHFRIHHYIKNPEMVDKLSVFSEQWYQNHKNIFTQEINFKNPIIFYNDHAY